MIDVKWRGAIVGGLAGLAIGLPPMSAIVVLADPGRGEAPLLAVIAGAFIVVGSGTGFARAEMFDESVRQLSSDPGVSGSLTAPLWPAELAAVAHRLRDLARERDQASESRVVAQSRLDAIVGGLRDGVIVIDSDLRVVSINRAAVTMLGGATVPAISRPLAEVARDADLARVARDAVAGGSSQTTAVDYRRAGRQYTIRVQPIEQAPRRLAILVVQDITDLRQLEAVRREFVGNVSHELRTPLASIRALVETLVDGAIDDETVALDFLERVLSEVDRLSVLIEDLLDLGQLESGRMPLRRAPISIEELARRVIERCTADCERAGATIRVDGPTPELLLHIDASRMAQVLNNLVDNAIKFSPRDGIVSLSWRAGATGVEIAVTDRGEGILAEDLPRIFERFYKSDRARQSSGTGLGLAIAKHIVAAHGGELTAESVYGQGATFTVRLPFSALSGDSSADRARPEPRLPEC